MQENSPQETKTSQYGGIPISDEKEHRRIVRHLEQLFHMSLIGYMRDYGVFIPDPEENLHKVAKALCEVWANSEYGAPERLEHYFQLIFKPIGDNSELGLYLVPISPAALNTLHKAKTRGLLKDIL